MKRDSRLSGVLHVLFHMAQQPGPFTSETLAKAMDTNPVVIRRIMAGLGISVTSAPRRDTAAAGRSPAIFRR